jgi:hypothetical protein
VTVVLAAGAVGIDAWTVFETSVIGCATLGRTRRALLVVDGSIRFGARGRACAAAAGVETVSGRCKKSCTM